MIFGKNNSHRETGKKARPSFGNSHQLNRTIRGSDNDTGLGVDLFFLDLPQGGPSLDQLSKDSGASNAAWQFIN
jgi:hypothetical protein